jgi:hypothetical protein
MKLDALAREIPYLETLVMALTPPDPQLGGALGPALYHQPTAAEIAAKEAAWKVHEEHNAVPPLTTDEQAQFLARFMPRPGRTTSNTPPPPPPPRDGTSEDQDEFLGGERGREMLP